MRLPLLHKFITMPIKLVAMIAAFMVVAGGVALAAGLTGGFTQAPGGTDTTTVTVPDKDAGQHGATGAPTDTTAGSDETDCTDVNCTETDCTDVNCSDVDCTDPNCPCVACDNYSGAAGAVTDDLECTDPNCPCVECRADDASEDDAADEADDADETDTEDAEDDAEDDSAKPDTPTTAGHHLGTASDTETQDQ